LQRRNISEMNLTEYSVTLSNYIFKFSKFLQLWFFSVDCILAFNIVDWFKKAARAKMVENVTNCLQLKSVVQP